MAEVLGIDATCDITTQYSQAFRDSLVFTNFQTDWPHHTLSRLVGPLAAQPHVDSYFSNGQSLQGPIMYVTGMGHGVVDTFFDYQQQPIWCVPEPLPQLKGTIVHLLSCQVGHSLGPWMIQEGVHIFWGYTQDFFFYHTTQPPANLADDNIAERFLRMDCIIDRGILSGIPADQIYDSVARYVMQLYTQLDDDQHFGHRAALLDNYLNLVCSAIHWRS